MMNETLIKYRTEIDDSYRTILVKEHEVEYGEIECNNAQLVVNMLNDVFRLDKHAEEYCYMLCMNTKSRIIGVFEISHGTVDAAIVTPRDVLMKALLVGARHFVVAHNHPSGDVTASLQDLDLYYSLKQASELIGVNMIDFIIVGRDKYKSFCEDKI